MKTHSFIALLLAMALISACSTQKEDNACFIHYTAEKFDSVTQAAYDKAVSENLTICGLDSAKLEKLAKLTYDQQSAKHPDFSSENNVDSIINERGFKTMVISPKSNDADCNIIYIHGGAFVNCFDPVHRDYNEYLLKHMNANIYMPLYPLAPNYTVSDTFAMILEIYKNLLKEKKPVYIFGDSAGGNITLCFTMYLHTLGLQMPNAIFPICPACDETMSNPELWEYQKKDIVLGADLLKGMTTIWADKGMSHEDPMVTPLNADVTGMCPVLFFVGDCESFYPDCMKMYNKLKDAGIRTGMLVGRGMWHVSIELPIPAREQFMEEIEEFIKGSK